MAALLSRRKGRRAPDPQAGPEDLAALARVLLGREPGPQDAVPAGTTLAQAAAAMAATPEHADAIAAARAAGILAGSAAAESVHPPGTLSPDGVAIVGTAGRLYIAHGANDFARQFRGELTLSPDGVAGWTKLLDRAHEAAKKRGVRLACLVIPDKLAIEPEGFPEPLPPSAPRPIDQLLAMRPKGFAYPLGELRRAGGASLRTDSHLTYSGAETVRRAVAGQLGLGRGARLPQREQTAYLAAGDLGVKFEPRIHDVLSNPKAGPGIEITEDNARTILDLGGHLGVRRVSRCADAPVDGRLVVFGDSYCYVEPAVAGNLGELLARTFREVHFLWAPFCWDERYVQRVAPDFVLMQMAERFAVTVPREGADVEALAAETLRRKGGIVPEEITDPAVAAPATSP